MPVLHTVSANTNFGYKAVLPSSASCQHWNTINSINTADDIKSRWNSDQWVSWLILCLHLLPFFAKTNWFIRLCLFLALAFFLTKKRQILAHHRPLWHRDPASDVHPGQHHWSGHKSCLWTHNRQKHQIPKIFTNVLKKIHIARLYCTLSLTLIKEDISFVIYMKVWKVTS